MNKENLRAIGWEVLRGDSWRNQFAELHAGIKALATQRGITYEKQEIELAANELIWEFLADGVLAPTGDDKHFDFRFLQLSESGKKELSGGVPVPTDDPAKYVERLAEQVSRPIHEIIRVYAREAHLTFLAGTYFASMVMLGVASEQCLDLLIAAYTTTPDGKARKPTFAAKIKKAARSSRERFETLRADLIKAPLPPEMNESLELQLSGLFTLVRYSRDADGEPIGRPVDRDTAHASLLLFPQYCKWAYGLIEYFETNEI